jgi:hypothetical protein
MDRAEIGVDAEEGTELEVARVRVALPDGRYAIWFLTLDTTGRAPVLELEAAIGTGGPKPVRVTGQWRKLGSPEIR